MADTVPILQIPVDDSQFRAFLETFNKFKLDAAEVPAAMADIERAIDRLPEHLRPGADALEEASQAAADALEDSGTVGGGGDGSGPGGGKKRGGRRRATRKREAAVALDWVLAGTGARRFAATISGATRDLARWEKLTGVFAGLLGAGGLYGLDVLAAGAARRRQESAGYGMSTGELASFKTNYGRLGDVGGVLEGLSGAETDFAKRQPLQSLGVDPRGKSSLAIFGEMLPKLKRIADTTDPRTFGPAVQARGLDKVGVGVEMMRLIRSLPPDEIETIRANAARDAGALGAPDDVGRKWQELNTALHKAGARFQTVIADELVTLTPGLTHLSETATALFDKLLARKDLGDFLGRVNTVLLQFADDVGSDAAQTKVREFLHYFDVAKSDFDAVNRWLENHPATVGALGAGIAAIPFGPAAVAAAMVGGALAGGTMGHEQTMRRQYEGGAAAERPTLEQRNLERKGLGLPTYKDQAEYDKAEPSAKNAVVGGANLMSGGQYPGAEPGANLVTITTPDGKRLTVNRDAAPSFEGFVKELEGSGYQVDSIGGYAMRANRSNSGRLSEHAYGNAIDINPDRNPFHSDRTDLPPGVSEMARKYGLSWGGDWRNKDNMHFEWRGVRPWLEKDAAAPKVGETPTKDDLNRANEDAYRSNSNPFLHRGGSTRQQGINYNRLARELLSPHHHGSSTLTDADRRHLFWTAEQHALANVQHMIATGRLKKERWQFAIDEHEKWLREHEADRVPSDMKMLGDHRRTVNKYLHPYARPKPAQTVTVTDNSGGSSTVTVAH